MPRYAILLLSAILLVAVTNFSPSKFLIGWDNLLPEFDLLLNIKRSLSAVWQNEALGLLGGNGHAAELPRQLLLLPLSFLPLNLIRQVFFFLMLGVGVFGAYFLIKSLTHYENKFLKLGVPLVGALFYLFNLATVQTFYAPLEPFTIHFAFLPWLLFSTLYFIAHRNFKSLLFFFITNILAIPQSQVPTIFVVYLFSLSFFLLVLVLETKRKEVLLSSLKVIGFTLLINAFWLLPFLYFVFVNSGVAFSSKINQMATETVFLQNKEFGDLTDVMLLKGFWLQNVDPNFEGKFEYMLKPWRDHLPNPILAIGYLFFAIILIGFIYVKRKKPFVLPFSALFLLSITMLATNTPPFSWIDGFLRDVPLFGQAFRFPFTKFSILAALTYSFFFAIGVGKIADIVIRKVKIRPQFIFFSIVILLLIFVFPIFRGHFFYEKGRVNFPPEYLSLFNYFNSQEPTGRIANFPQHTFWGWNYYRWGYGGSGFLWYGIPQPILDRAFDVWSKDSENYYWEISRALYSKNAQLFGKVLNKYNVEYLLVDKNILSTSSQKSLYIPELEEIIRTLNIEKDRSFGSIDIYKFPKSNSLKIVHSKVNNYVFGDYDRAYEELGNYISVKKDEASLVYPFRSLFSGKNEEDKEFETEVRENAIVFISNRQRTEVPKSETGFYINSDAKNCDNFRKGRYTLTRDGNIARLYSKNATACLSQIVNIVPSQAYLVTVENRNIKGRGFHFWVLNETGSYPIIDTYLSKNKDWTTSYFVLPPQDEFSRTYSLHFDNVSIADETENELGKISFYPIPYDNLTSLKLRQQDSSSLLVLDSNQAYDEGWKAYKVKKTNGIQNSFNKAFPFVFGKELKDQMLLNNWSNGWVLDKLRVDEEVVITYLPQHLQHLGFAFLLGFGIYIFKYRGKNS